MMKHSIRVPTACHSSSLPFRTSVNTACTYADMACIPPTLPANASISLTCNPCHPPPLPVVRHPIQSFHATVNPPLHPPLQPRSANSSMFLRSTLLQPPLARPCWVRCVGRTRTPWRTDTFAFTSSLASAGCLVDHHRGFSSPVLVYKYNLDVELWTSANRHEISVYQPAFTACLTDRG
jgi:hypothetical protein